MYHSQSIATLSQIRVVSPGEAWPEHDFRFPQSLVVFQNRLHTFPPLVGICVGENNFGIRVEFEQLWHEERHRAICYRDISNSSFAKELE